MSLWSKLVACPVLTCRHNSSRLKLNHIIHALSCTHALNGKLIPLIIHLRDVYTRVCMTDICTMTVLVCFATLRNLHHAVLHITSLIVLLHHLTLSTPYTSSAPFHPLCPTIQLLTSRKVMSQLYCYDTCDG